MPDERAPTDPAPDGNDVRASAQAPPSMDSDLERAPTTGDTFDRALGAAFTSPSGPALLGIEGHVLAGKYRLETCIGEGGMGRVYLARHLETDGKLAVKLLLPSRAGHAAAEARFLAEARNAAALQHPNTVRTNDFGDDQGVLYLVMEHVDGEPLDEVVRREGALAWRRVHAIVGQVLRALWEAHEHARRIVHRDIKPANIMLCAMPGQPDFVKVLDFGIARALDGTATNTQNAIGSPQAMAPEQWRGEPVDARTDLYAVGCMAYQLLSGQEVFAQVSGAALGHHHLHETPRPLANLVPVDTPEAFVRWVETMMAKQPDQRYPSAAAALDALDAACLTTPDAVNQVGNNTTGTLRPSRTDSPDKPHRPTSSAEPGDRSSKGGWLRYVWLALIAAAIAYAFIRTSPLTLDAPSPNTTPPAPPPALATSLSSHPPTAPTPAKPSTATTARQRPCPDSPATTLCSDGYRAWCDADGQHLACCVMGMVGTGTDGICACAPGGVSGAAASSAGCPAHTALDTSVKASIRHTMSTARAAWRACYEAALQAPGARPQGKIVLELGVGPQGHVELARIKEGAFPDVDVQACILDAVRGLRFEPPVDGWLSISYPVTMQHTAEQGDPGDGTFER